MDVQVQPKMANIDDTRTAIKLSVSHGGVSSTCSTDAVGNPIFGPHCIGEILQFTAHQGSDPILGVQWEIDGGNPVGDYIFSQQSAILYPLTAQQLVAMQFTCAFTTVGTVKVVCNIETHKGWHAHPGTVQINGPTLAEFYSRTGVVDVGMYLGKPVLMFGNPADQNNNPGILIEAGAMGAPLVDGQVGILQLACNQRSASSPPPGHTFYQWSLINQWVLDVGPNEAYTFYHDMTPQLPAQGSVNFTVTDCPAVGLDSSVFNYVSIGDGAPFVPETYQAFLMFYPSAPPAIWVPLAVLTWSWDGWTQLDADRNWIPVQDSNAAYCPEGVPTNTFPIWETNTSKGSWIGYGSRADAAVGVK
jgi:hypothetical protein